MPFLKKFSLKFAGFLDEANLVLCIFLSEFFKSAFILNVHLSKSPILLISVFFLAELVGAPLQGKISDLFGRKKLLLISIFTISLVSLFTGTSIQYSTILCIVLLLIHGLLGNADVIARAALIESHIRLAKNPEHLKKVLGFSFAILPIPWFINSISIISGTKETLYFFPLVGVASLILAAIIWKTFRDEADSNEENCINSQEKHPSFTIRFIPSLFAFLLLQIAFQIVYLKQENLYSMQNPHQEAEFTLIFAIAFLIGTLGQICIPLNNIRALRIAIISASLTLSLGILFEFRIFSEIQILHPILSFGFFTLAIGIYLPRLYCFYAERTKLHEHGLAFGILESIMVLAEVIVSVVLRVKFQLIYAELIGVILFIFGYIMIEYEFFRRRHKVGRNKNFKKTG